MNKQIHELSHFWRWVNVRKDVDLLNSHSLQTTSLSEALFLSLNKIYITMVTMNIVKHIFILYLILLSPTSSDHFLEEIYISSERRKKIEKRTFSHFFFKNNLRTQHIFLWLSFFYFSLRLAGQYYPQI